MKRFFIMNACLAMSLATFAQSNADKESKDNSLTKADSLRMDSIIHALPDVMVKGARPIVKVKGAALTYDLPQLLKDHPADNAYEAIKQLPGVTEDNDALTLNARGVTVMIDGKTTNMTDEQLYALLKSIPTNRIANAEVLYNAPARYLVKGQVINLQLKHNQGITALQGELFGGYTHQNRNAYTERASLLYTNKKWEIDMLYSFHHGKKTYYYDNEFAHDLTDGTSYSYNIRNDNSRRFLEHNIRLGINYSIAQDHQISFAYTSQLEDNKNFSEDSGDFASLLKINSKSQLHDFRLDYSTPFGFSAGAEYTYYQSPDEQWVKSSLFNEGISYDIASKQHINKWDVYLKQEHDLGNDWGLNYGANYTTSRDKSSQESTNSHAYSPSGSLEKDDGLITKEISSINQTEDQVSFYIGASKSFGQKLSMEISLEEEYYHTPAWHEWNLFPTFSLTYLPKAGHILKLDLSSDRDYPVYWAVKNFTTYSFGGYGKLVGNPYLKPDREYELSLTYILHSQYIVSLFIQNETDGFRQLPYQSSTKKEMEYKYLNYDHINAFGMMLRAPLNVCSWWKNSLTLIGVYQNEKNSNFYDLPFERDNWFCQAKWNGNFIFGKHLLLNLDGSIRTRAIQGVIDIPTSGALNAALSWKPLSNDKLQVKAYCNDIFKTADNYVHDNYKGQYVINEIHNNRTFGVSLTYRFGGYKAKQHEEVDTSRFGI